MWGLDGYRPNPACNLKSRKTPAYWCPGRDLNPYSTLVEGGFKPPVSASSTTRACRAR